MSALTPTQPRPRLTLSFDNGPDPEITPRVLDVLAERGIRAHFFVLGKNVAEPWGRRIVERACAEGHSVGNHSFTHTVPLGQDAREGAVQAEIGATEALLEPLVAGPKLFRPFGGGGALGPHLLSPLAVEYLLAYRYTCVLWNSVPRDWVDPEGWPARALADCEALPHVLLVLHDIANASLARLGSFLDTARDRGIEIGSDLPPECVPIVLGRVVGDLDGYVGNPSAARA